MSKNILTKALLLLVGSALTLNLGCKPEKSNARNLEQIIKPYIESRKIKNIELSTDVDPLLKAHKDIKDVTSFDTNADTDVWMFYLDDKVISGNKIPFKDKKKLISYGRNNRYFFQRRLYR